MSCSKQLIAVQPSNRQRGGVSVTTWQDGSVVSPELGSPWDNILGSGHAPRRRPPPSTMGNRRRGRRGETTAHGTGDAGWACEARAPRSTCSRTTVTVPFVTVHSTMSTPSTNPCRRGRQTSHSRSRDCSSRQTQSHLHSTGSQSRGVGRDKNVGPWCGA